MSARRDGGIGGGSIEVEDRQFESAAGKIGRQMFSQISKTDESIAQHRYLLEVNPIIRQSAERAIDHFEMQIAVGGIGVGQRDGLVQFHAEAGTRRRNHEAILPPYRGLENVRVKSAPLLNAFQDQEIGAAGGYLK